MSAPRRITLWTVAVLVCAGSLNACGAKSTSTSSPVGTARPSSAAPNAVESNPGGDIPDSQAFVPFRDPAGRFTVTIPEGWARTSTKAATTFTDKYNSVRVESRPAASAPSVDSARSADVPAIQAAAHGFVPGKVSTVSRRAGTAVLVTYSADSPPNPVTSKVATEAVERYAFWRNGREAIITVSAPVGSDNVDPWRKVTDSFGWLSS